MRHLADRQQKAAFIWPAALQRPVNAPQSQAVARAYRDILSQQRQVIFITKAKGGGERPLAIADP